MLRTASIIDYPRSGLDESIWDVSDGVTLQPEIRDQIEDIIGSFLDDLDLPSDALLDVFIYGSILTNQYNPKTDVDARILLDPEVINAMYPNMTGDDLYDLMESTIHGVKLGSTKHPLNATVVIEGEETELGRAELGGTEKDTVYSIKEGKIIHEGTWADESFDPDTEFSSERQDIEEIIEKLETLIRDTRLETIDYQLIEEAIGEVANPEELIAKMEEKLAEIESNISALVCEYKDIKKERSRSYKEDAPEEDRHRAPGNVRYKLLEKYRYTDVIKKLIKILDGGISDAEVDDVAKTLNVSGQFSAPLDTTFTPADARPVTTYSPAPPEIDMGRVEEGGMMHGASCPHCGHNNGLTAGPPDAEVTCSRCHKKFNPTGVGEGVTINTAPSTEPDSAPYASDVPIYGATNTSLSDFGTVLRDLGVSPDVALQVEDQIDAQKQPAGIPQVPQTPSAPQAPEGPQAPQAPSAPQPPAPQGAPSAPTKGLKPGKPMKQLSNELTPSDDRWWLLPSEEQDVWFEHEERRKQEFIKNAEVGQEYRNASGELYAAILPEMSTPAEGAFRVQWFSPSTPIGHTVFESVDQVAKEIFRELGSDLERADGSMDKFALSEEWAQALIDLARVREHNKQWLTEQSASLQDACLTTSAVFLKKALLNLASNGDING